MSGTSLWRNGRKSSQERGKSMTKSQCRFVNTVWLDRQLSKMFTFPHMRRRRDGKRIRLTKGLTDEEAGKLEADIIKYLARAPMTAKQVWMDACNGDLTVLHMSYDRNRDWVLTLHSFLCTTYQLLNKCKIKRETNSAKKKRLIAYMGELLKSVADRRENLEEKGIFLFHLLAEYKTQGVVA